VKDKQERSVGMDIFIDLDEHEKLEVILRTVRGELHQQLFWDCHGKLEPAISSMEYATSIYDQIPNRGADPRRPR
jgi:hypothetical protein